MDHNMRSTWNFYSPTTWVSSKSPLGKSITASPSSVAKAPLISCSFVRGVCLRGSKTGKQPRGFRTPDTWKSGLPNVSASVLLGGEIMAGNCGSCGIGAASWQRKDRNSWPLVFFFQNSNAKSIRRGDTSLHHNPSFSCILWLSWNKTPTELDDEILFFQGNKVTCYPFEYACFGSLKGNGQWQQQKKTQVTSNRFHIGYTKAFLLNQHIELSYSSALQPMMHQYPWANSVKSTQDLDCFRHKTSKVTIPESRANWNHIRIYCKLFSPLTQTKTPLPVDQGELRRLPVATTWKLLAKMSNHWEQSAINIRGNDSYYFS